MSQGAGPSLYEASQGNPDLCSYSLDADHGTGRPHEFLFALSSLSLEQQTPSSA
jgi:hypothetical protein